MDLDLALWQLNPQAAYLLSEDKTAIVEWRGPGEEPTADQLAAAWTAYQAAEAAKVAAASQPNPTEQALLAQVEAAQTIDDMKAALKNVMAAYVAAGSQTPPLGSP